MQKTPFHAFQIQRKEVWQPREQLYSLVLSETIISEFHSIAVTIIPIQLKTDGWVRIYGARALPFNANILSIDRLSVRYEPLENPNGSNLC